MTARAPIAEIALALVARGAPDANAPERRLASEPSRGGDEPCVLDGQELACWSSAFWDAGTPGVPLRIRLP